MAMKMLRRGLAAMIAVLLLAGMAGCGKNMLPGNQETGNPVPGASQGAVQSDSQTEPQPEATVPADGNPEDVTCKGSYSRGEFDPDGVAASMALPGVPAEETEETEPTTEPAAEEVTLTNAELQVWYWMEVAAYRAGGQEGPDFEQGLDTQRCPLDENLTWQQYFLQRALNTWHTSQALVQMAQDVGLPTEEAHQPNPKHHVDYLTNIPATKYLYGYYDSYVPNEMHQAYLDGIPALLEELAAQKGFASAEELAKAAACADGETLAEYARVYNLAYMYFTNLHYYIEPTAEEIEAYRTEQESEFAGISGRTVDIRHILLSSQEEAQALLEAFRGWKDTSEPRFAELAHDRSQDAGSALNGGACRNLAQGQLAAPLDAWCFDETRQPGDTELIQTDCGWHILYFCGSADLQMTAAQVAFVAEADAANIATARETYPLTVDYSAITLADADSSLLSSDDILYADIAHERYPTVPLYLQQEYPTTRYGAFPITTHGCGITTMAMLASYMTDSELTPPEMCARFGRYCLVTGTDSKLFEAEPAGMGFYFLEKTYDGREAKAALEKGHLVVCVQHKGYWTRGGHFLIIQEIKDNGMVIVRDSNIYNYGKLHGHKSDEFNWNVVTPSGMGYWIYDYKITRIPACHRCGEEDKDVATAMFTGDYTCEKCIAALERRDNFRNMCGT
jgi:hypothetical protein